MSLLYGVGVYIRNYLYDIGWFKSTSFETPTICIGNLSTGGTGKTPMAEFLISLLQKDYKVALLSRGYRRKSSGFLLANDQSTVGDLGDEPYQIHSKFPRITVAVEANRQNGIRVLQDKISPDVILLDDAFQHRRVKYRLSILLTAYGHLYCDDRYLPTGDLRDSKSEAHRADVIIVTKCPTDLDASERQRIAHKLKPRPHQKLLYSALEYDRQLKGNSSLLSLDSLKDKNFTLVTGIANPRPLVAYLRGEGLRFEHVRFNDHHAFTEKELAQLGKRNFLLTTEKDYMRLKGKVENLYYLPVRHRFLIDGQKVLEELLENSMKSNF